MSRKYLVWSDIFPYVQSLTILVQRIKKKVSYTQTWNDETCGEHEAGMYLH